MQLIGLALLVAVVFYGFAERDMTTVSAFDLHAFVVVIGGSATAILTASSPLTSLRTLTALRELVPGAGVMTKGTQAIESARQEFATLWRDGRRAQAVSFAESSALEPIRQMLKLVLARASDKRIETVFMELRHAEVARYQPGTANWELLTRLGPSFGMVGTVTGMIQLFRTMGAENTNIGAAISMALVATLYGIGFGAGVAGPIGHYLRGLLDARLGALDRCRQTVIELAEGGGV